VRAEVEDVEDRRVLVGALHLLGRRAPLGVAVRAPVISSAKISAQFRTEQGSFLTSAGHALGNWNRTEAATCT
jgi:hypothetical protein